MPLNSVPIYGVEQYLPLDVPLEDDYGGGAEVTQENLLITLWTNPNQDSDDLSTPGELIKPLSFSEVTAEEAALLGPGFRKQALRSRLSTKFRFLGGPTEGGTKMLAILNPPQELKESFLLNDVSTIDAVALTGSAGFNTGLSSYSQDVWSRWVLDEEQDEPIGEILFSGFHYGSVGTLFAKTNGADGVWPQFYELDTPDDIPPLLNALRSGAPFYIAALISCGFDAGVVDIRWPFSGAARG